MSFKAGDLYGVRERWAQMSVTTLHYVALLLSVGMQSVYLFSHLIDRFLMLLSI
jgi:hypothetical protein